MISRNYTRVMLVSASSGLALFSVVGHAQQSASPVRYTVDAETVSGMGSMAGGGMGAAMAMMQGRTPEPAHQLILRHGAQTAAAQPVSADHFMPAGMRLSKPLRLLPSEGKGDAGPGGFEMPRGKLLLFWGCGARAPAGQPVVIDFARLAKGNIPPGLFAAPLDMQQDWQVTPSNSRPYTDWPNKQGNELIGGQTSMLGQHRITSTYGKEISFTLGEDFMPPLNARTQSGAGGSVSVSWAGLPKATGYYAWSMGAREQRGKDTEMVWWTSAKSQAFGGPMWDWISPAGVRKLIDAGTVMPPHQSECTVPAEVVSASGEAQMVSLQAFGPQADFSFPARPKNAAPGWQPDWIARVRYRSGTMLIPAMADAMAGLDGADNDGASPPAKPKKPKCSGLAGLAKRAAGLCE